MSAPPGRCSTIRTLGIRRPIVAIIATVLGLTVGASQAAAAPEHCRVRNADLGETCAALQAAVDAADRGHRLAVTGNCHGLTTIDRDLVIEGVEARRGGRPILDGDGENRVVRIKPGASVTIRDLIVQGGRAGRRVGLDNLGPGSLQGLKTIRWRGGGGIYNEGVLRLQGASLVANNVAYGYDDGGIYNAGTATLHGSSSIVDNNGSGVHHIGTFRMNGSSSIRGHTRPGVGSAGGIDNVPHHEAVATLVMNDRSSISSNGGRYAVAGGVFSYEGGTVTMNDRSSIWGNRGEAGGVESDSQTTFTMTGSSVVRDNHGTSSTHLPTGGVHVDTTSTATGVRCAPRRNANVFGKRPTTAASVVRTTKGTTHCRRANLRRGGPGPSPGPIRAPSRR